MSNPCRVLLLVLLGALAATQAAAQVAVNSDFGDAPSPYPTAVHQFTGSVQHRFTCLGRSVSNDVPGANPVAGGFAGDTFDDGIMVYRCRKGGTCSLNISCWSGVDDETALGIWMDFNDDGDWDDAGEQVVSAVAGIWQLGGNGGFSCMGGGGFNIAVPSTTVGATVKTRLRIWPQPLNTGEFGTGGSGNPSGICVGGECEDHEIAYDGSPEIFMYNEVGQYLDSGDNIFVPRCPPGLMRTYRLAVINTTNTGTLQVSDISISNVVDCVVSISSLVPFSLTGAPSNSYAPVTVEIVLNARRGSFDLAIANNDTTGDESPFILHFTCGRGLEGNYTISNGNGTPAPDFADIGEAFDELELCGVLGDCTFEIEETGTPYVSNASYGLGIVNNLENDRAIPIWGLDTYQDTVVFRNKAGQRPKVTGSGASLRYGDTIFSATIGICAPMVTVEGLEVTGGQDFCVAVAAVAPWMDDAGLYFAKPDYVRVRQCMVHDCAGGPGIGVICNFNEQDIRIEQNFVWDCHVGAAYIKNPVTIVNNQVITNASDNQLNGAISVCCTWLGVAVRHNTILANAPAPQASFSCCLSFVRAGSTDVSGNIMVNTTSGQPLMYVYGSAELPTLCDHNGYQQAPNSAFCIVDQPRTSYSDFAAWQGTSRDAGGVSTTDMKFRRITAPIDLHLRATSPMVDAYQVVGNAIDVDGEARPQRFSMDIGADEVPPDPAMVVKRGSVIVPDGGTDNYGSGIAPNTLTDFTYTIFNQGQGPLVLTGTPRVELTTTPAFNAYVTSMPVVVIAPLASAQFVVTVTSPTGAFGLGISIATNDPGADPFNWTLVVDTEPTITVSSRGQPVTSNQVLMFPFGTTVENMGIVITVNDADSGQAVSLLGTVSANIAVGMVNSEFCSPAIPAPYSINPTSGALTINQGSSHLVTLMASDSLTTVFFTFIIEGEPAATLVEVLEGGPNGISLVSGASPVGTIRSFALRDIKAGPSNAAEFALKNVCAVPLSVGIPQLQGLHDQDFHVNAGGHMGVLNPGECMNIFVTFDPIGVGHRTAILEIYHAGMNHPNPFVLPLEGDAVDLPPVVITSVSTLPMARTNSQYGQINLQAQGGMQPYKWTLAQGGLPDGIRVTEAGAVYGFTTGNAGDYRVGIRVRDMLGNETMREFDIRVLPPYPPRALPNDGLAGRDNGAACAAGAGGAPWWLLVLPMYWIWTRIRRREA